MSQPHLLPAEVNLTLRVRPRKHGWLTGNSS